MYTRDFLSALRGFHLRNFFCLNEYLGCGYKGLGLCRNNGCMMENMNRLERHLALEETALPIYTRDFVNVLRVESAVFMD